MLRELFLIVLYKLLSWDQSHYVAKALIAVPKLRFNFQYKVKGHVVALNLNGHGNGYFEAGKK